MPLQAIMQDLYEYIIAKCKEEIPDVQTGIFGADMKISLINDGPFTCAKLMEYAKGTPRRSRKRQ